jgi:hypothetical protein
MNTRSGRARSFTIRISNDASHATSKQVSKSTTTCAIIPQPRSLAYLPTEKVNQRQESRVPRHAQIHRHNLVLDIHPVNVMLQPIRSDLLVQHGIAGIRRKFQDEKKPQAKSSRQRGNWARENSLHR